ncbi:MAG: DUF3298 and DUF4163 domain-containing protein [Prevotellaceae bacterium]|jgi:hypothetical protein|nr:DUF3298 and DUF4163 domain-containing protein [Prevotellaceae bacterium]
MNKFCVILSISIIAISCGGNKRQFNANVNFEQVKIEENSRKTGSDSSYNVSVIWNKPLEAPLYLNDSIMKYTKLLFASWFNVSDNRDFNASVANHMEEYLKRVKTNAFREYNAFDLHINPEEIYQNKQIISLAYSWNVYEGGAHGNYGKYCFVINKNSGNKISYNALIRKDKEQEFLQLAEQEFKTQFGIKANENLYELYTFEDDKFHLPDEFHFTPSGLVFYYNPYEIAPYSAGLIELLLPYNKIQDFVNYMD